MEDILASIRRILSEEEPATAAAAAVPPAPVAEAPALDEKPDDVLVLDSSMLVPEEAEPPPALPAPVALPAPAALPEPVAALPEPVAAAVAQPRPLPELVAPPMAPSATLLAPETAAAATSSIDNLMRTLATERTMQVHRGGPTIEDIVRDEMRPLLKQWLDANLPDLVERLVRTEIERVVRRAMP